MSGELRDISQRNRGLQSIQRRLYLSEKCLEPSDTLAAGNTCSPAVAIATDHAVIYTNLRLTPIVTRTAPGLRDCGHCRIVRLVKIQFGKAAMLAARSHPDVSARFTLDRVVATLLR